jgi:hypothetical protein
MNELQTTNSQRAVSKLPFSKPLWSIQEQFQMGCLAARTGTRHAHHPFSWLDLTNIIRRWDMLTIFLDCQSHHK